MNVAQFTIITSIVLFMIGMILSVILSLSNVDKDDDISGCARFFKYSVMFILIPILIFKAAMLLTPFASSETPNLLSVPYIVGGADKILGLLLLSVVVVLCFILFDADDYQSLLIVSVAVAIYFLISSYLRSYMYLRKLGTGYSFLVGVIETIIAIILITCGYIGFGNQTGPRM